jgi:hypothetical protein
MKSGSVFGVMIDRRCRVRSGTSDDEAPLQLDDDGFLDPSAAEAAFAEHLLAGALVGQQVAATARALVLLGEPGAGRSTVLRGSPIAARPRAKVILGSSKSMRPTSSTGRRITSSLATTSTPFRPSLPVEPVAAPVQVVAVVIQTQS